MIFAFDVKRTACADELHRPFFCARDVISHTPSDILNANAFTIRPIMVQ